MPFEELKAKCKRKMKDGKSSEEIIEMLYFSGITITVSTRIIMELLEISLGEAKVIVADHPVWTDVVSAASPLHNDLIRNID